MNILGLSALDRDATACVYANGTWHAVAEERLSRVKQHRGFPERALQDTFERSGVDPAAIDAVVYPFRTWWVEGTRMAGGYLRDLAFSFTNGDRWVVKRRHLRTYGRWCVRSIRTHRHYHSELIQHLGKLGLANKLIRVEHHHAHAASGYVTSGFDEALGVTLDWYGGGLSGSISRAGIHGIKSLHRFRYPHSLGLFFAQVTSALRFRPSRHEGKIVGLAAYGDRAVLGPRVLERFVRRPGDIRYRSAMDYSFSQKLALEYPPEHVAAAYQHTLEVLVQEIVSYWLKRTGLEDVVLAGGVAANVRMNQRIAELANVRRLFVHPNMGDGGTGVGAICAYLLERSQIRPQEWQTCFLGPEYSEKEMRVALEENGIEAVRCENLALEVARLLADGKVVARFHSAAEYGPRALGDRSILCAATDPAVNDWLNHKLGRTEFMPFAPATLAEHCHERFRGIDKVRAAARFMTVTCDCTELMRQESPAAVHVDGTARPQIVASQDNEDLYAILKSYYELTGIPTIINTSFNMHEEPMVCTPKDALRAFHQGRLDYLAIGPFLVCASHTSEGATFRSDAVAFRHTGSKTP